MISDIAETSILHMDSTLSTGQEELSSFRSCREDPARETTSTVAALRKVKQVRRLEEHRRRMDQYSAAVQVLPM